MMVSSKHYHSNDLECKCGCGVCNVDPIFISLIDEWVDKLTFVPRANRICACEKQNRRDSGASNSPHLVGLAGDFGFDPKAYEDLCQMITAWYDIITKYNKTSKRQLPFRMELGYNYIHLDIDHRKTRTNIIWYNVDNFKKNLCPSKEIPR